MEHYTNPLFEDGKMVVKYVLPEYLNARDLARFACTCRFAKEAVKAFELVWQKRLKTIADRYRMKLTRDSKSNDPDKFYIIDNTEQEARRNHRMYRVEGTNYTFRMFTEDNIATCAELRGWWAWVDNSSYYEDVNREDTMFTNPIHQLKTV